jgi:hypothetical protein
MLTPRHRHIFRLTEFIAKLVDVYRKSTVMETYVEQWPILLPGHSVHPSRTHKVRLCLLRVSPTWNHQLPTILCLCRRSHRFQPCFLVQSWLSISFLDW